MCVSSSPKSKSSRVSVKTLKHTTTSEKEFKDKVVAPMKMDELDKYISTDSFLVRIVRHLYNINTSKEKQHDNKNTRVKTP